MKKALMRARSLPRELQYRIAGMQNLTRTRELVRRSEKLIVNRLGEQAISLCVVGLARLNRLAGRNAAAMLNYGWLILKVPHVCRETMGVYRRVDALMQRHPRALAAHQVNEQLPQRLLFFIGHSRSGHSLVGSLLDAHPNVVIANEQAALKNFHGGASLPEVMRAMKYNSHFHAWFGRTEAGYDYQVPGQYQGRATQLMVLGDKMGNGVARLAQRAPQILDHLEARTGLPFVLVHVIRNPYDNIATKAARSGLYLGTAARRYFAKCDAISRLKNKHPEHIVDVYLDDLIASPRPTLRALCKRIGIETVSDSYLEACASILFKGSRRTARKVAWPPELFSEIGERLTAYSFLARFRLQDAVHRKALAAR